METLPVELLHRIFNYLDAETIIFSIRPVCRYFLSAINTYNQYVMDLTFISKRNFYVLCRLINPENVISLILYDNERISGQIALFTSLVCLSRFTRLRFLTLRSINECQLNLILKNINLDLLTSFSFSIKSDKETTMEQSNRRTIRMKLTLGDERISTIIWPIDFKIRYLTLNMFITMKNLTTILQYFPHLYTLILNRKNLKFIVTDMITFSSTICFRQLRSLTINDFRISFTQLESFLLLTPSLVYLQVTCQSQVEMLNGTRWQTFCEMNLTQLNQFEFYFSVKTVRITNERDLMLVISSFRTSFWIEHKRWFVTCECDVPLTTEIRLYSMPICSSHISYMSQSRKISVSTDPVIMNNDRSLTKNINLLELTLTRSIVDDIQENNTTMNNPLFHQVTVLHTIIHGNWSLLSRKVLSCLIDISRITLMKISVTLTYRDDWNSIKDTFIFLEELRNLSILTLECRTGALYPYIMQYHFIHSFIPRQVKHLEMQINNLDQIKTIFERCQNLVTTILHYSSTELGVEIEKWFDDNSVNTTCQRTDQIVFVWLGKIKIHSTETHIRHKRIKLTKDDSDS